MRGQFEQLHRERSNPLVGQALAGKVRHFQSEFPDRATAGHQQHLAAQQIQRLDTRGALIERGNPGIAHDLFHTVLADVPMPPEYLNSMVRGFVTQFRQETFEDGRQEPQLVVVGIGFFLIAGGVAFHHMVSEPRGVIQHRPPAFGDGFLGQQHAADIGMVNQAVGLLFRFLLS